MAPCIRCHTETDIEIHDWLPVCGEGCARIIDSLPKNQLKNLINAKRKSDEKKGSEAKRTKQTPLEDITPKLVRVLYLRKDCRIIFYYIPNEEISMDLARVVDGRKVTYYLGYHIHYGSGDKLVRALRAIALDYQAVTRGKESKVLIPILPPEKQNVPTEEPQIIIHPKPPTEDEPVLLTVSDDDDLFEEESERSSEEDLFGSQEEFDFPVFPSSDDKSASSEEEENEEAAGASTSEDIDVTIPPAPKRLPEPEPIPEPPKPVVIVQPPKEKKKKKQKPEKNVKKAGHEKLIKKAKKEFNKNDKVLNNILALIESSKSDRLLYNSFFVKQKMLSLKYEWTKTKEISFFKQNENAKSVLWLFENGKNTKIRNMLLTALYEIIFEYVSISVPNVDRFIEVYPNAFNLKTIKSPSNQFGALFNLKSLEYQMFFTQFVSSIERQTLLNKIDLLCFANRIGVSEKLMNDVWNTGKNIYNDGELIASAKLPYQIITEREFTSLSFYKEDFVINGDHAEFSTENYSQESLRFYYSQVKPFLRLPGVKFELDARFSNMMYKFLIEQTPNSAVFKLLETTIVSFKLEVFQFNLAQWLLNLLYKKVNSYAIVVKTREDVNTIPSGIVVHKKSTFSDPQLTTLYNVEPYFKRTAWNALKKIIEVPTSADLIRTLKEINSLYFRDWLKPILDVDRLQPGMIIASIPFVIEMDALKTVDMSNKNLAHILYYDPEGRVDLPPWSF